MRKRRNLLLLHGGSSSLLELRALSLLLVDTLSKELGVLSSSIPGSLGSLSLDSSKSALALKALRGNETLDLWSLGVGLLIWVLWLNLTADNVLANIILLAQVEELSDLGGSLWSQSLWERDVGQARNIVVSLLDDDQGQNGKIWPNNASTDGLSLALTSAAWSVARVAVGKEETDTGWMHNTLLHWETLLVVSTGDLEDISLPLISNAVTWNFLAHSFVVENADAALIVDFDELLGTV